MAMVILFVALVLDSYAAEGSGIKWLCVKFNLTDINLFDKSNDQYLDLSKSEGSV